MRAPSSSAGPRSAGTAGAGRAPTATDLDRAGVGTEVEDVRPHLDRVLEGPGLHGEAPRDAAGTAQARLRGVDERRLRDAEALEGRHRAEPHAREGDLRLRRPLQERPVVAGPLTDVE